MSSNTSLDLFPRALADAIRVKPRSEFVPIYGSAPLLLVHLDDPNGELAARLHETCTPSIGELHPNVVSDEATSTKTMQMFINPGKIPTLRPPPMKFDPAWLRSRLGQASVFVVALRKRASACNPFLQK